MCCTVLQVKMLCHCLINVRHGSTAPCQTRVACGLHLVTCKNPPRFPPPDPLPTRIPHPFANPQCPPACRILPPSHNGSPHGGPLATPHPAVLPPRSAASSLAPTTNGRCAQLSSAPAGAAGAGAATTLQGEAPKRLVRAHVYVEGIRLPTCELPVAGLVPALKWHHHDLSAACIWIAP